MAQKEFIHVFDKCSDFDNRRKDIRKHEKNIPNVFSVPKCVTKFPDTYLPLENVNDKLSMFDNNRKDVREFEKSIPNVFTIPKSKSFGIYPLSVVERDKKIPNVFQIQNTVSCATTPTSKYTAFVEYMNVHCRVSDSDNDRIDIRLHEKYIPNMFSWSKSNSFGIYPPSVMERDKNIPNLFKMQKTMSYESLMTKEKTTKRFYLDLFDLRKSKSESWNSSDYFNRNSNNVNSLQNDSAQNKSLPKKNLTEDDMSTVKAMWCVMKAKTIRGNPNKPFPVTEIEPSLMVMDIKRMLTNRGTKYFIEDTKTKKYLFNGKYSIYDLSPDMFENMSPIVLECANLFKILASFVEQWEEDTEDSLFKTFLYALSRVLSDFERTVHAVPDESLLALLGRLPRMVIGLRILAEICDLDIKDRLRISPQQPSAVKLINKVYNYLSNCQLNHSVYVRTLVYILDYCCLIYFRILSDWTLRGVISEHDCLFIKYSDDNIAHESQSDYDNVIIDENIEVPDFMKIFKEYILTCGRSAHMLRKLNDIDIFSTPTMPCCFDYEDVKQSFITAHTLFNYTPESRPGNTIRKAPNVFRIPDWDNVENNEYDLDNPYGFFMERDQVLTYHGNPINIPDLLKNLPYTLLIPSRVRKINCNREILDRLFKQENLLDELQYLSQCFFLVNSRFTSKLCETLYESMSVTRDTPYRLFNPNRLSMIVDEAIQSSFPLKTDHGFSFKITNDDLLEDEISIKDVECIELDYEPKWPKNIILTEKIILKYRMLFVFANKLEYVTWCLSKAREILSIHKNDIGLQFRQINLFKHAMCQFTTSMHQYFKQVVISECWTKFDKRMEEIGDVLNLYTVHKEYMHGLLSRCFMVVGLRDKLILLNKIYMEILNFYRLLENGYFYCSDFQWVHTDFDDIEESYFRFSKLRKTFYESLKKTIGSESNKHSAHSNLQSLIIILGP